MVTPVKIAKLLCHLVAEKVNCNEHSWGRSIIDINLPFWYNTSSYAMPFYFLFNFEEPKTLAMDRHSPLSGIQAYI